MKGKRIISSLLSMAMVFTLNAGMSFAEEAPVTEEPVVEEQPVEEPAVVEEQPVIEEEPVAPEEQQPTEEEPAEETQEDETSEEETKYPAQTFTGMTPDGKITVEVQAGEGALPKDASMRVENVNKTKVTNLVDPLIDGKVDSLSAVNVIFTDVNGNEVEPLTEIIVNIKTNELSEANRYQLVHIDQADNAERIAEEKVIGINDKEATFATDVFSIYVIVSVTESGAIDFDETFGSDHITVHAPDGAFAPGTEMVISSVDDVDKMAEVVSKYGKNKECSIKLLDISFYKDGVEVEPSLPVEVTWDTPMLADGKSDIIHITDDGKIKKMDASVSGNTAIFTADSFSDYGVLQYTQRYPEVDIEKDGKTNIVFEFDGERPTQAFPTTITSGALATNAPKFEDYAFKNATIRVDSDDVEVLEIGAFTAYYEDASGTETAVYNVYYRTEKSLSSSDILVLLADQQITLHYTSAPLTVTYKINYDGHTYTVENGVIPDGLKAALRDDADSLKLVGPESIAQKERYERAITVQIPRGFEGRTTINGTDLYGQDDYLGAEPKYSLDDANKIITKTPDTEIKLEDVYGISASTTDQEVVLNLVKRNEFTFDASYFLKTVYTGGNGTQYGDRLLNSNRLEARITSDSGTLNSSAKGTITDDHTYTWSFWTNEEVPDDKDYDIWMIDALEINGTKINIPYTNSGSVSAVTTLPSGIEVVVSLDEVVPETDGIVRHYTITVSNAYQDVVISGGNIVNTASSTEIIPEVLENVEFEFYGYSTGDKAIKQDERGWKPWTVGPISSGQYYSGYTHTVWGRRVTEENYNMYGFNQNNRDAMKFKVPEGYSNPRIAFVSTDGTDLKSYIKTTGGITLSDSPDAEGYYEVSGQYSDGYYYFGINDFTSKGKVGLLRIKATKNIYGINYVPGQIENAKNIPAADHGGYNVIDKSIIALDKSVPTDPDGEYVFLNYTIVDNENPTTKTYAPGQKLQGDDFLEFISHGKIDSDTGEYIVTLKANWKKIDQAEMVWIYVDFYIDGNETPAYSAKPVQVAKGTSLYVDIDSDEMKQFMEKYNWELFYDEFGSDPYYEDVQEETHIRIECYSKFYVYHSGSGTLELHTKKELLPNKNLDLYSSTTNGFLYGGWYMDYAGDTANEIEQAARDDASDGLLSPEDVAALSNKQFKVISNKMPKYKVTDAGKYDGAWSSPKTTDGRSIEVPSIQEGQHAPIYYVKEVPSAYLSNYYQIVYNKDTKILTGLYLISAVDDLNYNDAGFVITTDKSKSAIVVKTMTFTRNGKSISLKANTALAKKGIVNQSYLTYVDASDRDVDVFKTGTFNVLPYWVTPDGIQVTGVSTRTVTIDDTMTKDGISCTDKQGG